jgi:hypothetical protein
MQEPPPSGNPYVYVRDTFTNLGSMGVLWAWNDTQFFYGDIMGQAYSELQNNTGGLVVV